MSRIGLKPLEIPEKVEISVDQNIVKVKGPKGELEQAIDPRFKVEVEDNVLTVVRPNEEKEIKALHGLYRTLIANMVDGVVNGYSKTLQIEGTGYRAERQGNNLILHLGYSHEITIPDHNGVVTEVPDDRTIVVKGCDKQAVGNFAAVLRDWRKPEPYKGKGVRYNDEHVRRKEGKTGK